MTDLEETQEKPMTPAERMYKNHLKNVAKYQKANPEKCRDKMRRYTESLKNDNEKREREIDRRRTYYLKVVKPKKDANKQQKQDEIDKVKAEARKHLLELDWEEEENPF